jgi:hypothetical protein
LELGQLEKSSKLPFGTRFWAQAGRAIENATNKQGIFMAAWVDGKKIATL